MSNQMKEAHALVSVEMMKQLKDEIVILQEKSQQPPVPEAETQDPLSPFGGPETEPIRAPSGRVPNTLGQILTAADLRQFKPPKDDTEGNCPSSCAVTGSANPFVCTESQAP